MTVGELINELSKCPSDATLVRGRWFDPLTDHFTRLRDVAVYPIHVNSKGFESRRKGELCVSIDV